MKRQIIFTIIFILTVFSTAFAQEEKIESDDSKIFSITLYPVPALIGWYSAEAEIVLTDHFSLAAECTYYNAEERDGTELWHSYRLQCGPGVRFYPRKALNGWFAGIYADYLRINVEYNDDYYAEQGKGLGTGYVFAGWIGYKWIFNNLVLEASTGYGYSKLKDITVQVSNSGGYLRDEVHESDFHGGWTGIGLGIGIAF